MKKNARISSQPRKVRGRTYTAPLHVRQKMVAAHLSKELRAQYKRRSLPVRTGDKVKVLRGDFKGTVGKVEEVNLTSLKAFMENVTQNRTDGKKVKVPIDPSNLLIIEPNLEDKMRKQILLRSTLPKAPKKTATTTTANKQAVSPKAVTTVGGRK